MTPVDPSLPPSCRGLTLVTLPRQHWLDDGPRFKLVDDRGRTVLDDIKQAGVVVAVANGAVVGDSYVTEVCAGIVRG